MANKKLLGIHLTPNSLKLVELEPQAKGQKVLNWSIDYFPADKAAASQVKALTDALKNKRIGARQAALVLTGTDLVYKLVDLPPLPEKEVASALKFKLGQALSFPLDNAIIDYYKLAELQTPEKQLFFAAAIPKDYVINIIKLLKKAGISVKEVVASSSALSSAAQIVDQNPYALVYVGKFTTLIILVKRGQVVFSREVAVGGDNITQSMVGAVQTESGRIELDHDKAENLKDTFGIPIDPAEYTKEAQLPGEEILAMMRPALEKMTEEILRTFAYYRETSGDQVDFARTYFTGGVSKTKNLLTYLTTSLGIEVAPLVTGSEPSLSLAIGAGLLKKPYLSLLPYEYKNNVWTTLNKHLNLVATGLAYVLILSLVFGFFFARYAEQRAKLAYWKDQLSRQMSTINRQAQTVNIPPALIKALGLKGRTDRFVKVMGAVHRLTPADVYFTKLNYDRLTDQLLLQGVLVKRRSLAAFIDQLKKSPYFQSIDVSNFQESNAYTVPTFLFEIKCVLAGD